MMHVVEWCTVPFTVKGEYIKEQAGVTNDEPDKCYPEEGGYFEAESIYYDFVDIIDLLPDSVIDRIVEMVEQKYQEAI